MRERALCPSLNCPLAFIEAASGSLSWREIVISWYLSIAYYQTPLHSTLPELNRNDFVWTYLRPFLPLRTAVVPRCTVLLFIQSAECSRITDSSEKSVRQRDESDHNDEQRNYNVTALEK